MKSEKQKKDRKLIFGIVTLLLLIIFVTGTLLYYKVHNDNSKNISARLAEELSNGDFEGLSKDESSINKVAKTAAAVLEKLSKEKTGRDEMISALSEALLQCGLDLTQDRAAGLAEWLVDFYLSNYMTDSNTIQTEKDIVDLENTLAEQMHQDLNSIYEYLTRLDETVINNKQEILNLTTEQGGSFESVNTYLESLKKEVNNLKEQFTAYENSYSNTQNSNVLEFGSINLQLSGISQSIENTQSEITKSIHNSDLSNASRYEALNSTVNNFASSLREDLESVNKNISKILKEFQESNEKQNVELAGELQKQHEELLLILDTLDQDLTSALEKAYEDLSAQLDNTQKSLSEEAAGNKTEIINQINSAENNLTQGIKEAQEKTKEHLDNTQNFLSEEAAKNKVEISEKINNSEKNLSDKVTEAQNDLKNQLNNVQKNLTEGAAENKTELSSQLTTEIAGAEEKISNQIKKTEKSLLDSTNSAKTEVINQMGVTENNLSDAIKKAREVLETRIDNTEKVLTDGMSEAKNQIQNQVSNSEKLLKQGIDNGVSSLLTNLDNVHADISSTRTEIESILKAMGESDAAQMTDIITRFTGINNKLVEINAAMDNTHGEIKGLIGSLQVSSEKNQENLLAALTNIDASFSEQNTENYALLVSSLQTQTDTVQKWFEGLNNSVTTNFRDLSNTVGSIEQSANANKEEVLNNFNQSFANLSTSVGNIGQAVADGKDEIISRISDLEIKITDNYNKIANNLQSVFQSASNGKQLLASALLAKNVNIAKDATFQQFYDAILAINQQIVIGTDQIPGTITYEYHYHEGDPEKGTGCYTKKLYHQHSPECYSKATCTVTVHANGGFWSEGDDWCPCHGNVHRIKQNVIRKHSACGAADNYGQISFTEHHGPGTDGFNGYDSSTHTYDKLSCGKTNATFVGWDVGCGFVDGQIIGAHIVYDQTAQGAVVSNRMAANLKNYSPQIYNDYVWIHNEATEKPIEQESETETETETETMIEYETMTEPETVTESETIIETDIEPETEAHIETDSSETSPETEPEGIKPEETEGESAESIPEKAEPEPESVSEVHTEVKADEGVVSETADEKNNKQTQDS